MSHDPPHSLASAEFVRGLPAPGDREPAALRQDIADEIADHLQCAARNEQFKSSTGGPISEQAALAAAIERFGDPAAIARRLWWDAVKEKIMAQRILTGMATVVAVASLLACGMLWRALQTSRDTQDKLIAAQRSAIMAMTAELKSAKVADGSQWQTLKIHLVDEDARPAPGVVTCAAKDKSAVQVEKTTDAQGLASFLLPPGQYALAIKCNGYSGGPSLLLPPEPMEQTIVCPSVKPTPFPVSFDIELTDQNSLVGAPKPLYYLAEINFQTRHVDGHKWWPVAATIDAKPREPVCWLIDSQGRALGQLPASPPPPHLIATPWLRNVPSYFPATLEANIQLQPVDTLTPGDYIVILAAYAPVDPTDAAATGSTGKSIPALRRYAPDFNKFWKAKMYSIDRNQPTIPITDVSFPQVYPDSTAMGFTKQIVDP